MSQLENVDVILALRCAERLLHKLHAMWAELCLLWVYTIQGYFWCIWTFDPSHKFVLRVGRDNIYQDETPIDGHLIIKV